jgi:protein-L-isoaspartate(D-aspartate) O-methyltransferase
MFNFLILSLFLMGKPNYLLQREQMVREQIEARGVKNESVLRAMSKVPREKFVPREVRKFAYIDSPLPIGDFQTISQPYIVALMTELLNPDENKKILEIGTGSGYQAAVLSEIVKEVYTIELLKPLAMSAKKRLREMGYRNVTVKCGDGYKGWKEYAPFDGIIVTCAPKHIPKPLLEQLAVGGRMVIPVGEKIQNLILVTKTEEGIHQEKIIPVRFVSMRGEAERHSTH